MLAVEFVSRLTGEQYEAYRAALNQSPNGWTAEISAAVTPSAYAIVRGAPVTDDSLHRIPVFGWERTTDYLWIHGELVIREGKRFLRIATDTTKRVEDLLEWADQIEGLKFYPVED